MKSTLHLAGLLLAAGLVFSACSDDDPTPDPTTPTAEPTSTATTEPASTLPPDVEPGQYVALTGIGPNEAGAPLATIVTCWDDQIVGVALLNLTDEEYLQELEFDPPLAIGVHDIELDESLFDPNVELDVMTAGPDDGAARGQSFSVEQFSELSADEVLIADTVVARADLPGFC